MKHTFISRATIAGIVGLALLSSVSHACTRCVYLGSDNTVIVGRSMDWAEDPGTNLYCFPRGMKRNGAAGLNSIDWTSKYGSIVCAFYDVGTVDGMNEQGLVVNALFLVESDYGKPDGKKPVISIAAWGQYVLDNFSTVSEAVEALRKEPFDIIAPILPNGSPAQGHLSISDPAGDSAIFEYVKGKLVIHHGREYQVMTNSPIFSQQLAINKYWEGVGGMAFLPGTNRASDRFARASFFISAIPEKTVGKKAVASVFSIIRGVSVPLGLTTPGQPNISGTIWRTVHDQKNRVLYFDSATSPTVFWVEMAGFDFNPGAPVKKLQLSGGETYNGNAMSKFVPAEPFKFLSAE